MPYFIVYRPGEKRPWKIVRKSDRKIVGSSTTRVNAQKSINARMASEKLRRIAGKRRGG